MFLNRYRIFVRQNSAWLGSNLIIAGFCLIFFCASAQAEYFGIQLGAYKNLSDGVIKRAEALGEVSTIKFGAMTRVVVGSYMTHDDAADELARIHSAGFADAFVTQMSLSDESIQASDKHTDDDSVHFHLSERTQKKLDKLSIEQRKKVVILDGEPHLKEGGVFKPL